MVAAAALIAPAAGCGGGGGHRSTSSGRTPSPTASASASATPSGSGSAGSGKPGWGSHATYVGRYRLVSVSGGADRDGRLTLFMRTVFQGQPPVPSGILSLHGARNGTSLFYLTDLSHSGGRRLAAVRSGSFDGPVVGRLDSGAAGSGSLAAVLRLGGDTMQVRFRRFSTNPHP